MRKFGVLVTLLLFAVGMMAQESAAELKNAGNEALRNKKYVEAIAKYEAYLATGEEGVADDYPTIYNLATAAYKAKKMDKATTYYNKSIENDYKPDLSLYYISKIHKAAGNEEKEVEALLRVINEYPTSKYAKKFQAYIAQKYNKAAQEPYNKGNNLAMEAAASGDAGIYLKKMQDAIAIWEEAKLAFEKTLSVDEGNTTAKSALKNIADQIKAYQDYKLSLQN